MRRGLGYACAAAVALGGCGSTTDSLGYDDSQSTTLHPITGPASYPNPFGDLLGETDAAISDKISGVFNQLFHGDPSTQAIYFTTGTDQAYVEDVLHGDVRTEGMGLGMLVAVELDKQDEFDALWTYAKASLEVTSGPDAGYFNSFCDAADMTSPPSACLDPYGFEQFVTALLFANDRWGSAGSLDYAGDALALFHTLRHKTDDNGGVVAGVTDMFDATAALAYDVPNLQAAGETRPALEMPGYYALWAEADADPFWSTAATAARAFWPSAANPTTGFMPVRALFDGTPLTGWDTFSPEGYRAQINVAIDQIWSGGSAFNVTESNQLLTFFSAQGISTYGTSYTLDGTPINTAREPSLVVANGISAVASTNADRSDYVSAVWNMTTPTGPARYYAGILELVGLLILGGQLQVY